MAGIGTACKILLLCVCIILWLYVKQDITQSQCVYVCVVRLLQLY